MAGLQLASGLLQEAVIKPKRRIPFHSGVKPHGGDDRFVPKQLPHHLVASGVLAKEKEARQVTKLMGSEPDPDLGGGQLRKLRAQLARLAVAVHPARKQIE